MAVVSTVTAFPRPYGTNEDSLHLLYQRVKERQTGATTAALLLTNAPIPGSFQLFKNGTLLDDPSQYTLLDRTVTLGAAAIAGDVFNAFYHFRITRTG
jgi:hypothetical protein